MEISHGMYVISAGIARDYFRFGVRDFSRGANREKCASKGTVLPQLWLYNQNANSFENKRCKSIEIGCKRLNITWRCRSLKSITEDYRSKVTPSARGLAVARCAFLTKHRGLAEPSVNIVTATPSAISLAICQATDVLFSVFASTRVSHSRVNRDKTLKNRAQRKMYEETMYATKKR